MKTFKVQNNNEDLKGKILFCLNLNIFCVITGKSEDDEITIVKRNNINGIKEDIFFWVGGSSLNKEYTFTDVFDNEFILKTGFSKKQIKNNICLLQN